MQCPKCHFDNPEDTVYCGKCAAALHPSEELFVSHTETLQTPSQELKRGTTFAGRYEIIEEIGKGGMGNVYRVFDKKIEGEVALKLVKPEIAADKKTIERFRNELKLAREIAHRNVCRMYDLNEDKGTHYITMEYVPGEDLKSFIRRAAPLSTARAVSIAKQVCEGLAEAHRLGVVHRDLKPSNIMIDKEGNARIMDFGIARSLKAKGITGAGVLIGTPEYMSPEQVEGKEADKGTDIYSLGVILFEMVTSRLPFEGDTPLSVAVKQKSEAPPDPRYLNSQIPENLSRVILKCLEKEKAKRFETAEELHAELINIERGIPTTERLVPKRKSTISKEITVTFNLKKLLIPALAIVAVAIAAFIILRLIPHKKIVPLKTGKPSIAVMYFENRSGEPDLDKILVDMLTTNLSRNKELEVVNSQRLFDILNQMGKETGESIDRNVATEIATRAGVNTMLLGSIIKIGNKIRITSQLASVQDGALIASEQVDGSKIEDVFGMVDELTAKLIPRLGVSAGAEAKELTIADVTTSSLEAYRYYQKGLENLWKWRFQEAAEQFQRAVDIDFTFAMAYLYLALAQAEFGLNLTDPFFDRTSIKQTLSLAKKYADKVTERERLFIAINLAGVDGNYEVAFSKVSELVQKYPKDKIGYFWLGNAAWMREDFEKARNAYEKMLEIDPTDGNAYNMLAYTYSFLNDHPRAISTVKKYMAVHPDVPNSYDSAWEIHMFAGLYDEALTFLEELQKRFPNLHWWHQLAGYTFLIKEEADRARTEFRLYADSVPAAKVSEISNIGCSYLLEGRYSEAEAECRKAVELAQKENKVKDEIFARFDLGKMLGVQKKYIEAIKEYNEAENISWKIYNKDFNPVQIVANYLAGVALVSKGDYEAARSRAVKLDEMIKKGNYNILHRDYYHLLFSELLIAQKNGQTAINEIEKSSGLTKLYSTYYRKLAAAAYALQANFEKAIEAYQNFYKNILILDYPVSDTFCFFLERSRVDYNIAKIYDKMGDKARAIEYYQKFLDLWKNADPGISEVEDAKKHLAALKAT